MKKAPPAAAVPRTPRAERTRAKLIAAARAAFSEQSLHDVTIGGIAKRAKVAHGSFYTHFQSKEEIFREVLSQVFEESFHLTAIRRDIGERSTPLERIEATNRRYLTGYKENARIFASLESLSASNAEMATLRARTRAAYINRTAASIRHWQQDGLASPDVDAEAIAHVLGSTVERFAYMRYVFGEGPADEERALAALNRVWATSLGLSDKKKAPSKRSVAPTAAKRTPSAATAAEATPVARAGRNGAKAASTRSAAGNGKAPTASTAAAPATKAAARRRS